MRIPDVDSLWRDLSLAGRLLRRAPVFTLCSVLMLALAIGATTAVFSIVNAAFLRPVPHVDLDRWARLYEQPRSEGLGPMSASIPNYRDWKRQSRSFAAMVLWMPMSLNLSGDEADAERVPLMIATTDALHTLGVRPAAGRLLQASDEPAQQGERPVMISYGLWQRRFGGDPEVVGRTIRLNLNPFTVVGVAPRDFEFPPGTRADVWVPQSLQAVESDQARDARGMQVSGLLRPGVTWAEASAELDVIAARLAAQHRENEGFGVRVVPVRDEIAGPFRAPLFALLGALGLVMLLVSVNVANLQLVRLEARRRELAVRAAIGASRARLVRQVLMESALLALAAGGLGLLLAPLGVRLVLAFVPEQQIAWLSVPVDLRVLLLSAGVTCAVLVVSGLLPAARGVRIDVATALAAGGRAGSAASTSRRLRRGFVVAQLALSFVLVAGAALMIQSFVRLHRVDPGFPAENRLTLSYMAPRSRYPDGARLAELADRLRDEVSRAPGVVAAGAAQALPFAEGATWFQALSRTDPRSVGNLATLPHVHYNVASPGYAEALGLPVKAGRTFGTEDTAESLPVVVVNEALAQRFFPGEDPIGQQLWVGHAQALPTTPPRTVIGVVGDARWESVDTPAGPEAWVPVTQQVGGDLVYRTMLLVVHTTVDPLAALPAVRERIRAVDKDLALASVRTLEDRVAEAIWRHRLGAAALGALGLAALAIALVGVFGVTSQLASRRAHELGVRVALGATPKAIARLVLGESGRLVLAGVALGVLGALGLARALSSLLFGIEAWDTATFVGTAAGLATAAMLASYVPARQASRADPLVTLRGE
jgi:putative ABC transport system permease protein